MTPWAAREDVTMFLSTFLDEGSMVDESVEAQQALLPSRLSDAGWEVPAVLERMADARSFYFDRVSQIRMLSWTHGRVALLGDAAACGSLLAGQGSALAILLTQAPNEMRLMELVKLLTMICRALSSSLF